MDILDSFLRMGQLKLGITMMVDAAIHLDSPFAIARFAFATLMVVEGTRLLIRIPRRPEPNGVGPIGIQRDAEDSDDDDEWDGRNMLDRLLDINMNVLAVFEGGMVLCRTQRLSPEPNRLLREFGNCRRRCSLNDVSLNPDAFVNVENLLAAQGMSIYEAPLMSDVESCDEEDDAHDVLRLADFDVDEERSAKIDANLVGSKTGVMVQNLDNLEKKKAIVQDGVEENLNRMFNLVHDEVNENKYAVRVGNKAKMDESFGVVDANGIAFLGQMERRFDDNELTNVVATLENKNVGNIANGKTRNYENCHGENIKKDTPESSKNLKTSEYELSETFENEVFEAFENVTTPNSVNVASETFEDEGDEASENTSSETSVHKEPETRGGVAHDSPEHEFSEAPTSAEPGAPEQDLFVTSERVPPAFPEHELSETHDSTAPGAPEHGLSAAPESTSPGDPEHKLSDVPGSTALEAPEHELSVTSERAAPEASSEPERAAASEPERAEVSEYKVFDTTIKKASETLLIESADILVNEPDRAIFNAPTEEVMLDLAETHFTVHCDMVGVKSYMPKYLQAEVTEKTELPKAVPVGILEKVKTHENVPVRASGNRETKTHDNLKMKSNVNKSENSLQTEIKILNETSMQPTPEVFEDVATGEDEIDVKEKGTKHREDKATVQIGPKFNEIELLIQVEAIDEDKVSKKAGTKVSKEGSAMQLQLDINEEQALRQTQMEMYKVHEQVEIKINKDEAIRQTTAEMIAPDVTELSKRM